jgi:hypothetical protein
MAHRRLVQRPDQPRTSPRSLLGLEQVPHLDGHGPAGGGHPGRAQALHRVLELARASGDIDLERAAQWCQVADRFIDRYGCPFPFAAAAPPRAGPGPGGTGADRPQADRSWARTPRPPGG